MFRNLRAPLFVLALGAILALGACSSDGPARPMDGAVGADAAGDGPQMGQQGGPCFPNNTCFSGLRCVNEVCEAAADGGAGDGETKPDGASKPDVATPDGTVKPDSATKTDGATMPDSAVIKPDSAVIKPDSAVIKPDVLAPDLLAPDTLAPDTLAPDTTCVPNCAGQVCGGPNGCGGSCKTGSCAGPQDVCIGGLCQCQPSCSGAFCGGPDGCGGSCAYGSCPKPNSVCNGGSCVCAYASCGGLCCGFGEYCLAGACTPGATPGWKVVSSPTLKDLNGVWGSASNDVWAVGADGTVLHFNGQSWGPDSSGTTSDLHAVSGSAANNVWAISTGQVLRYDGSKWSVVSGYPNTTDDFAALYVAPTGQAFVAGNNGKYYSSGRHPITAIYNGTSWTRYEQTGSSGYLRGIGGSSAADVWAQGWSSLLHYNGSWQPQTSTSGFWNGIFATAPNDVWVAGWNNGNCFLKHYDGASWSSATCPTSQGLQDAHGTSASDIWAVGSNGTIIHYDGKGWAVSGAGVTKATLYGVWAASPTDVWAVGTGGTILRYSP